MTRARFVAVVVPFVVALVVYARWAMRRLSEGVTPVERRARQRNGDGS